MKKKKVFSFIILIIIFIYTGCDNNATGGGGNNGGVEPGNGGDQSLTAPKNIEVRLTGNELTIAWDQVENVKYYALYKKYENGEWKIVKDLIPVTHYTEKNIEYDVKIYYGVSCKKEELESAKTSTSNPVNISSQSITVKNLKAATLQSNTGINLSWSKLTDTTTYHIYRSETKNTQGAKLGSTSNLTYTDNTAESGKIYYYKVLWSDTSGSSGGESISQIYGFYHSLLTDTKEPDDNDKKNITVESFTMNQDSTSLLFKKGDIRDTDWFIHTVPAHYTHYLNGNFTDGTNSVALVNVYNGNTLVNENLDFHKDTDLKNLALINTGDTDIKFYIQVTPKSGAEDYIKEYKLKITLSTN